jgi:hypothetical protein
MTGRSDRAGRAWWPALAAAAATLAGGGLVAARARGGAGHPLTATASASATASATATLHVPRVGAPIVVNAELEGKAAWEADTGNTGDFKDAAGHGMVPYSEAKLRWGGGMLYLMLYAGDLDLEGKVKRRDGPVEKDDAFHLEFGAGPEVRVVSVSVLGTVADALCTTAPSQPRSCDARWKSQARVAVDRDGTLNKIGDHDEEWVVEMAIPLRSLGVARAQSGTRLPFSVRRCEVGHARQASCGGWGNGPAGELVLDP